MISLHRIGDTVFTIPAVRFLYEKYGNNIVVACFKESSEIYSLLFSGINFIIIPRSELKFGGRIASLKVRKNIKGIKPAIIFDITGSINSASLLAGLKAENVFGITNFYFKNLYNNYVIQRSTPHLIDLYFDIITKVFSGADVKKYREFEGVKNSCGKILIHPFAGWKAKEWSLELYFRLAQELAGMYDVSLIFEKGKVSVENLDYLKRQKINFIETVTFNKLIESIKTSVLFIGNDSGPVYVAGLLGKPTFTVYSSTNPAFSLPFGGNHRFIIKKLKCSAGANDKLCSVNGGEFGCNSFECLNKLSYDEVAERIKEFISELKFDKKIV